MKEAFKMQKADKNQKTGLKFKSLKLNHEPGFVNYIMSLYCFYSNY